ncbi:O-antigen ligase family protein [Dyadobacter sp. LHD-138]|uniref:O-antigen ligase family protein n=1 Tax=Dyadobacter sp. LHD-138 TaxID=3071413 RepID=UPI0027DF688F|nr:O-antigen ligase family protein [Dyadobacter sp. LHD-138]MDQ6477579.1 O-antigen ligase family protein [Dyadobacter sp. LHD-138]
MMSSIPFSSNTFWAYPTLIIGIVALIKMKFTTDRLLKRLYYISIFAISLIAVYFSARRSPLFVLILTSVLLFLPPRIPHILLISLIVISSFSFLNTTTGKNIIGTLPDSYSKYRIERMFGWVKDRKETSYLERKKIWNTYLDKFYRKPVFGEGLSAVHRITKSNKTKTEGLSAHNTFIGLLAETGLMGTTLMIIILGRSIFFLKKAGNPNWVKIYILLFIPTLLINWVEYNLIPGQIFFLYTMIIWLLPRGLQYLEK